LTAAEFGATPGPLGKGRAMRLLFEAVILVVIIYIAVRMFRKRG
jgi:hypothetical protein